MALSFGGAEVSGSLYNRIEETTDALGGAFKAKLEAAVSECGGRLDRIRDVIGDYDELVQPRFVTSLTALKVTDDTSDSNIARMIDAVEGQVFFPQEAATLWGMDLAEAVWFVRKLSGKNDAQIFHEIFGFSDGMQSFTEADLIEVYRGGGGVDRNAPAAKALLAWLGREFGYLKERYASSLYRHDEQLELEL